MFRYQSLDLRFYEYCLFLFRHELLSLKRQNNPYPVKKDGGYFDVLKPDATIIYDITLNALV